MKKKLIIAFIISLITFLSLFLVVEPIPDLTSDVMRMAEDSSYLEGRIYDGKIYHQTFYIDKTFNNLYLYLANPIETEGKFIVQVVSFDGNLIYECQLDALKDISKDYSWTKCSLNDFHPILPGYYNIVIFSEGISFENSINIAICRNDALWKSFYPTLTGSLMFIKLERSYVNYFAYIMLSVVIISFSLVCFVKNYTLKIFIILFGLGLCYLFGITPLSSPDDQYHYSSSLLLSNILLNKSDITKVEKEYYDFDGLYRHTNSKRAYLRQLDDFKHPFRKNATLGTFAEWDKADIYLNHPIKYIPQALGISLGRVLGLNFSYVYFLGRFINLLFYSIVVAIAITIVPFFKKSFLIIAMFPMSLQMASSYNRDACLISISMLFVALLIKILYSDEMLLGKDLVLLFVLLSIIVPIKIVYIPFIILLFAIPNSAFRSRNVKSLFILLCIIGLIVVITVSSPALLSLFDQNESNSSSFEFIQSTNNNTVWDIVSEPIKFIKVLLNSIYSNFNDYYIYTAIGGRLSGLSIVIKNEYILGILLLFILSIYSSDNTMRINRKDKTLFGFTFVAVMLLILASGYIWTRNDYDIIQGVQGRYFIPILLLTPILLHSDKIKTSINDSCYLIVYVLLHVGVLHNLIIATL